MEIYVLDLKKTSFFVMVMSSSIAFSGTMGAVCSAVNVTAPCENTAWDFGGRALYLRADSNPFLAPHTVTQGVVSVTGNGANPEWGWGFQLEGSYHYSTGNDLNLNWYHYRSGAQTKTLNAPVTFAQGYDLSGQAFNGPITLNAEVDSTSPSWDQVNIEFGQYVDFGENKFVRLHGGMSFSRVGMNGYDYDSYTVTVPFFGPQTLQDSWTATSVYNGFGPRVGLDLNHEWGNGIGIYANGAMSLLVGSTKSSYIYSDWNLPDAGFAAAQTFQKVVSEFDAKIGAMYSYPLTQGELSLDLGWMWAQYNDALLLGDNQSKNNYDFGIQGLYFGLKWVGNFV